MRTGSWLRGGAAGKVPGGDEDSARRRTGTASRRSVPVNTVTQHISLNDMFSSSYLSEREKERASLKELLVKYRTDYLDNRRM